MNWLKSVWNKLCGAVKSVLDRVLDKALDRAKEILADKELCELALEAVMDAAKNGLNGNAAWKLARNEFKEKLESVGKELKDCAIDTTLQLMYDAWKSEK